MTPANILGGPISKVEISTDGGTTFDDLGAIGGGNAEIDFEPVGYELADGQKSQRHGLGTLKVEVAETDATKLALASTAKDTETTQIRVTDLNGKTYTTSNALANYAVKRGFGDEPHILTITQQKKCLDEDEWCTQA